jgi:hypothetical protein
MKTVNAITISNSKKIPIDNTLATSGTTIALDVSFTNSGPVIYIIMTILYNYFSRSPDKPD